MKVVEFAFEIYWPLELSHSAVQAVLEAELPDPISMAIT